MANNVRIGVGVDDKASRPIRDIHDAFLRLQRDGAKGLGIGLGAAAGLKAFDLAGDAIHGVAGLLGDAAKAAAAEEDSIASLTASLKANVPAWSGNTAAIEATLAARMRLGHADDEQRESLARLIGAIHDVPKALDLERTAMDLAAFKHVDLATASEALIKIEGGQFRALKELIGSTKDITTAEQALAAVQSVAQGSAEALATTNSGKLKASNVALGESMEKLGGLVLPAVVEGMALAAEAATKLGDALGVIPRAVGAIGPVVEDVFTPIARLQDDLHAVGADISDFIPGIGELRQAQQIAADAALLAAAKIQLESAALLSAKDAADGASAAVAKVATGIDVQTVATLSAKDATDLGAEATNNATRAALALTVAVGTAAGASDAQKQAAADARAEFDKLTTVFDGFNGVTRDGVAATDQFGFSIDGARAHAQTAYKTFEDLGTGMGDAADRATDLKDAIELLPTSTSIEVITTFRSVQEGSGIESTVSGGGAAGNIDTPPPSTGDLTGTSADPEVVRRAREKAEADAKAARDKAAAEAKQARDKATRDAKAAADKALREAKADAAEHARAVHEQLDTAYDKLRDTAREAFQAIHEGNLKSIEDARDSANAALDAQEKAIRGKVSAEQQRINDLRDARQERELRQNVADVGADPKATAQDRADAVQSLADFLDDQRIARLQSDADTNVATIEAQKTANDALAQADKDREDTRFTAQEKARADELTAIKKHIDKVTGNWSAAFALIASEAKRLGVDKLLGVKPLAVTSAAASVAPRSIVPAVSTGLPTGKLLEGSGRTLVQVFLDSREIAAHVTEKQISDATLRTPTHVSTGSMR